MAVKPTGPKNISQIQQDAENKIVFTSIINPNLVQKYAQIEKVYVKVIAIALTDLTPVHMIESNSPYVTLCCGTWDKSTNTILNAGNL